jgi:hypothetical protein
MGRRIDRVIGAQRKQVAQELLQWPWRFRRAGGGELELPLPSWRVNADEIALAALCRVYVGNADHLDAIVREPGFRTAFAKTIRVVEIVGRTAPAAGTLTSFSRARAIVHADGELPWGPWRALEGRITGAVAPGVTRLALHGAVGDRDMWPLSHRPIHALWLGNDTQESVLAAMAGGYIRSRLRRLWTGSIPVETVLAAAHWPNLARVGGPVWDNDALVHALGNVPRIVAMDLDVPDVPPLASLADAGVRCIRISAPRDPSVLLSTPAPGALRWFALAGFVQADTATALARWAPRHFACEPTRPTGLAWLGF